MRLKVIVGMEGEKSQKFRNLRLHLFTAPHHQNDFMAFYGSHRSVVE